MTTERAWNKYIANQFINVSSKYLILQTQSFLKSKPNQKKDVLITFKTLRFMCKFTGKPFIIKNVFWFWQVDKERNLKLFHEYSI